MELNEIKIKNSLSRVQTLASAIQPDSVISAYNLRESLYELATVCKELKDAYIDLQKKVAELEKNTENKQPEF